MKNLTNILSYLWLLLLMAVTACSDLVEEVGPMHVEEEVELNIQLHVPDMQASTREEMVITENISSIVAIAFDESDVLIKKVDAILSDQDHGIHNGTLKIKVPKRTRTIHFLGNYTKESIASITSLETLNNFTTTDYTTKPTMRYWGMTTFDGSNINQPVTLYRNMAKLTLKTGDGFTPNSCYIAGFVNRNISGTIVPGGHAVGNTPTIPNNVEQRDYTADNKLGNVYYLFEHANVENNNPLYVIIEVDDKYYKIAFASGDTYFPILRNRAYEITVTESLDEMYAEANYPAAVNSQYPINDLVITSVSMTVTPPNPAEVQNESGLTFTVTVTIPEGITELNVPTHDDFTITPPDGLTAQDGKYIVTPDNDYAFSFTVKEGVEAGDKTISFSGRGKYLKATGSANIALYDNATLSISPTSVYNTAGSTTTVSVPIPQGITSLTATSEAFTVTSNEVSLNNGSFDVSGKQGQSVNFTLTLKDGGVGEVGDTRTVTFSGSGDYKRATGTATVTLAKAPAQGSLPVYELWFEENNGWNGSTDYATFFTKNADITTGNGNANNMESTFYDGTFIVNDVTYSGADNHRSYAMTMGDGKSIGFTITEPRYLTMLVAANSGTPSINLTGKLANGETWTTTADANATTVVGTYNFGNGEITTAGRLICYTLDPGTYTLQGSNTSYLLYYLRVSTEKPTMTDIVQPTVSDYALSWSGGEYGNWIYDNSGVYVVDDDAKTFTLTYTGLGLTEGTLSLSNSSLTIPRYNEEQDTYTINGNSAEITNANVGTYSYTIGSGEISNPTYKYSNFYDKIALKAVNGNGSATVKHSVKLKLTNGDIYQDASKVVDYYDLSLTDPRLAICTPETRINTGRAFTFTITENWTYRGDTNKTLNNGSSMMSQAGNTFTIAQGQETSGDQTWEHPFWYTYIYYLDWGSFADTSNANRSLSTMTISTEDEDIWFSYKNQGISKSMVIEANQNPGEVVEPEGFQVSLDFFASLDGNTENIVNRNNNSYEDLLFETSRLYLKASIPEEIATNTSYIGQLVTLTGDFPILTGCDIGGWAIDWNGSRVSTENTNIISYVANTGQGLKFTIQDGVTDYYIEWVFKTGQYYKGGDIGFTYNISNYAISDVDGTFNNFAGDTSATIGFTNEPIYLDIYSDADTDAGNDISIVSGSQLVMKATLSSDIAPGTQITFDLSGSTGDIMSGITWNDRAGQSVQFSWPNITLTVVENQRDYYLYWNPTVSDERSATLNFTVSGNYNLNSVGNTSYSKAITVTPNNNQTTGTVVWNEGKTYTDWSTEYIAVNTYIPTESVITIYTSSTNDNGGAFEMHDIEERSLRFTNVNYPVNNDDYYSVASGETSHSFTVTNETKANGNTLANGVDGLKINGYNVTITRIVVQYPSMTGEVFNRDFEDESTINGWGENVERRNAQEGENHYLVLANKSGGFAQASLDRAYVPGNYTLTYKIKGNASDSISQVFQYFNDNQNIYESVVGSQSVEFGTDDWTIVTLDFEVTRGCNRLLFDYSDFTGEIYIDDLRLVKND